LLSFVFNRVTTAHGNHCSWGSRTVRAHPPHRQQDPRVREQPHQPLLQLPDLSSLRLAVPKPDTLVLLRAKVFGRYTLANFFIALRCSAPDTNSSLGRGCWPQESHSQILFFLFPQRAQCAFLYYYQNQSSCRAACS